jgi:aryl-alcohol dehydrogenase-like predicted oxidoreductase
MKMTDYAGTGIKVSSMALGCLPFGSKLDKERSYALLDYYRERGGNFLDTANNYSFWDADGKGGESETLLGEWMVERGNREELFISTKLGAFPRVSRAEFFAYKGNPWADLTEGLSREAIERAVEGILRRLRTDHVDLLFAHVDDRRVDQEETLEAFDRVVRAGKARSIGCSNFKVWRLARARELSKRHGWEPFKAVQMFHTYFQTEKFASTGMADQMGEELFDYVSSEGGICLLGYTPLLWGSYTQTHKYEEEARLRHFLRPQNEARRKRLEQVAAEAGASVNQVIYAWMMQSEPRVIPLVAVSRVEHLAEDLDSDAITLTKEQMALLNAPLD